MKTEGEREIRLERAALQGKERSLPGVLAPPRWGEAGRDALGCPDLQPRAAWQDELSPGRTVVELKCSGSA